MKILTDMVNIKSGKNGPVINSNGIIETRTKSNFVSNSIFFLKVSFISCIWVSNVVYLEKNYAI